MVNRVDKLTIEKIDLACLRLYATYNKLLNSFVLRIKFRCCKASLQIFVSKNKAMCFTCNFTNSMFSFLFDLLRKKYGVLIQTRHLCTTVWTFSLFSRVGELSKFYTFVSKEFPSLKVELEPELFPCITIVFTNECSTTIRIFHTGKVVLLGVLSNKQLYCAADFISTLFFDYSFSCNLENFFETK